MRADDMRVLERVLEKLSGEIHRLEREIEHADPKLRQAYRAQLFSLEQRRHGIEERLAELRLDQALAWERSDFATGVERVIERLTRGMDKRIPHRH